MQNSLEVMPLVTVADQLAEYGVVFESVGISFTRELSDEEFSRVAKLIVDIDSQGRTFFNFMLGDLCNSVAGKHQRRAEKLEKMFGKRYKQVKKHAYVALAFPLHSRDYAIPWWVYEEMASVPVSNRDYVLKCYRDGSITRDRVREWKRSRNQMKKEQALGSYPPADNFDGRMRDALFSVVMDGGSPNPLTGAPDYVKLTLPTWAWPTVELAIRSKEIPIYHA